MKKLIFATLFFGAALFAYVGCQQDDALASIDDLNIQAKDVKNTVEVGETFTLQYGEVVTVEPDGFTLFFQNMQEDSRCPASVECIWEGKAVIQLEMEGLDEYQSTMLETPNSRNENGNVVNFLGRSITLLELNPNPESANAIPIDEYQATIMVGKSEVEIGDNY